MVLQVTICHHVVVSLRGHLDSLATDTVLLGGLWAFLGRLEVMLSHIDVADNIVVHNCVFTRAEIPWFLLGVVRSVLKTFQLVLEVEDVIGLLVA